MIGARDLPEDGTLSPTHATGLRYAPFHEREPYAGVRVARDIAYGPHPLQRLDVFVGESASVRRRPTLMFAHAGGFVEGDKRIADTPYYDNVGLWAARYGLVGVTMNYRLAPAAPWPAGHEDVGLVVDWLRANLLEHGGDPQRVVLMGHSSGASHIAAYVAQGADVPAGAILVSGGYDPEQQERFVQTVPDPTLRARYRDRMGAYYGDDAGMYPQRSALAGLAAAKVPLLVAWAEHDAPLFHRQAEVLLGALFARRGRGVPTVCSPGQTHFSQILQLNAGDCYLSALLRAFIDECTANADRS